MRVSSLFLPWDQTQVVETAQQELLLTETSPQTWNLLSFEENVPDIWETSTEGKLRTHWDPPATDTPKPGTSLPSGSSECLANKAPVTKLTSK